MPEKLRELGENEETVRALVENAPQGILTVDERGRIINANAMAVALFGYSREELIGAPIELLLPVQLRERHIQHRAEYFREPRTRPMGLGMDLAARRKDGTEFPVEISLSYASTTRGNFAVAFVSDISARKRVENSLRKSEETVRAQAQELARSNADLRQFAYVATHDLQEPLRMISICAQMLELKCPADLDTSARECIGYLVEGVERMQATIQDMLSFARVAHSEPSNRPVSLEAAIQTSLQNLALAIQESGATIDHNAMPVVNGNEIELTLLFQNLISNAIKYRRVEEPPHIEIHAQKTNGECVVAVRDNGIGIDSRYHEQIFGMFKRLSRKTGGTGIGLAICKKIAEKHAGRIWVKSVPGSGSTFYVALPAK